MNVIEVYQQDGISRKFTEPRELLDGLTEELRILCNETVAEQGRLLLEPTDADREFKLRSVLLPDATALCEIILEKDRALWDTLEVFRLYTDLPGRKIWIRSPHKTESGEWVTAYDLDMYEDFAACLPTDLVKNRVQDLDWLPVSERCLIVVQFDENLW